MLQRLAAPRNYDIPPPLRQSGALPLRYGAWWVLVESNYLARRQLVYSQRTVRRRNTHVATRFIYVERRHNHRSGMQGTILLPLGSRPSMQPLHLSPRGIPIASWFRIWVSRANPPTKSLRAQGPSFRSPRWELHPGCRVRGPESYLLDYEGWHPPQDLNSQSLLRRQK